MYLRTTYDLLYHYTTGVLVRPGEAELEAAPQYVTRLVPGPPITYCNTYNILAYFHVNIWHAASKILSVVILDTKYHFVPGPFRFAPIFVFGILMLTPRQIPRQTAQAIFDPCTRGVLSCYSNPKICIITIAIRVTWLLNLQQSTGIAPELKPKLLLKFTSGSLIPRLLSTCDLRRIR